MSFNTKWDINRYKTDYESDEHWTLKKRFMEVHKDKFPEEELVCLAQVFTNIEFMGCKYPEETMQLVANLSKDVAKDFREERSSRLKRTFVKASDAAEARAKGTILKPPESKSISSLSIQKQTHTINIKSGDQSRNSSTQPEFKKRKIDLFQGLPFGKFVLFELADRNAIRISGQRCSIDVQEKESIKDKMKLVDTFVNGELAGRASSTNTKDAKALCFDVAFKNLKQNCYTIKLAINPDRIDINKDNETIVCNVKTSKNFEKIDSNNIGFKMMQKLGWSGGGLGSRTQGIENPVEFLITNSHRRGFGNTDGSINIEYFREVLSNYVKSDDIKDLYFDSSFTKDERATLHQVANEKTLKSSSHGKEPSRYLVISKKSITPYRILEEVLINKNPMYINKYHVRVPKQKANLFPDNVEFPEE